MLKSVFTVGGWTAISRILGFVRDILTAALLGAGPVADAFFVALKLPNFFRRLFAEGAFSAAFVPAFSGTLVSEGRAEAKAIAEQALAALAALLFLLALLAIVFMPQVMSVLAPGFRDEPLRFQLAVELGRITFVYLPLICVVSLLTGVLNGLDRFAAGAAAPCLFNLSLIAAFVLAGTEPARLARAQAVAVSVSGGLQLVLLAWAVGAAGMRLAFPRPRITPAVRRIAALMLPGTLGAGVTQINLMVDVLLASLLPAGAVSWLYYADRVNQLPLGVIGIALSTALLPLLSRQVRAGETASANASQNRAVEFALLVTLPAAVALVVAALPIVDTLFGRGAFGETDARMTSRALMAYALGLPAYVLNKVLAPAFFARADTATPVRVGIATVVLNIALALVLIRPLGHVGLALATAIAAIANVVALWLTLHRRGHFRLDPRLARRLPRIALASLGMGIVLWAGESLLWAPAMATGVRGLRWAGLGLLIALGLGSYAAAALALGAARLDEVRGLLRRSRG
ncbi:MAG: murein biosynthesis integral membrane protein MurJ [Acetobacteraceae bacterium]|nr:murein biosynthesis integral membrane protein MurJ [Acetobacteraceae bacterium]